MPVDIVVEGLHKYYGRIHAVRGASFTVPRGSVFGLLGPNGAGMGVVGYYIALGATAGIVQSVVGGRTGELIAELLGYADFSYHVRVVLHKWIYGSLEALSERILAPSYPHLTLNARGDPTPTLHDIAITS
ncbi:hypothetical protein [Hyperthermus butylicus]|uniref:ABC transporter ATP-binding protein n=1 Tax=Hyperthermus butylicus (strain DSM 5456 / JCM 9403 / PLM1-5) TaxID=415426 RepID=A2BNB8_HYPBU|nr:hypothetical protein Hbut_1666 [Hyperthermus butylicus DSM 5456]